MVLPLRPTRPAKVQASRLKECGGTISNPYGPRCIASDERRITPTGRYHPAWAYEPQVAPTGRNLGRLMEPLRLHGEPVVEPCVLTDADYGEVERRIVAQLIQGRETQVPFTYGEPK